MTHAELLDRLNSPILIPITALVLLPPQTWAWLNLLPEEAPAD